MAGSGRSASGAAAVRAMEQFVAEPLRLFDDPLIVDLLPGASRFLLRRVLFRRLFLRAMEWGAPGVRGALLCRTRFIDDATEAAVERGLDQVVILGAGLDTRPYRLAALSGIRVFEVDLPAVQHSKQVRLTRRLGTLPTNVTYLALDFNTHHLHAQLAAAGLDADRATLFVWEGVTQYLQPAAADATLRVIAESAAGSEVVFTYVLDEVVTRSFGPDRSPEFRRSVRRPPEPWLFGIDPTNLPAYLSALGLTLEEDSGASEHTDRYLRPRGRDLPVSEIERIACARV